jgi:hypothetical protein
MTISAVIPAITFSGTSGAGTLGPFSLIKSGTPINFTANSQIKVYRYASVTDLSPDLLVEDTDYTLTGGPTTGSITLTSPQTGLLTAERLHVYREQPYTQNLDLVNGGNFSSSNIEARLDRLTEMVQEVKRDGQTSVRFSPLSADTLPRTMPLDAAIDKIVYISGTASSPVLATLDSPASLLANITLAAENITNINLVGTDLGGADTIGIVAADLAGDNTIGAVAAIADTLSANIDGIVTIAAALDDGTISDLLDGQIGKVATLALLQTYTPVNGQIMYSAGRTSAGDGGGGFFRFVTGDQSANVTLDPGKGIWVAPDSDDTGASGAWKRLTDGNAYNTAWWNFLPGNSAAANTAGINAAFDYLRTLLGTSSVNDPSVGLFTGPGEYSVNFVDGTGIRGSGWSWTLSGATLIPASVVDCVADFLHSRQGTINNLVIKGVVGTQPRIGMQTGYISDSAVSSGEMQLNSCYVDGYFTLASYYNGGSEESVALGSHFRNRNSGAEEYAYIADGFNWLGRRSDAARTVYGANSNYLATAVLTISAAATATVTTAAAHHLQVGDKVRFGDITGSSDVADDDTYWTVATVPDSTSFTITGTNGSGGSGGYVWLVAANSFVQMSLIECAIRKDNGGKAVWMSSNCQRHTIRGYLLTDDDDGIRMYFHPSFSAVYPHGNIFDVGLEGTSASNLVELYEGESTTVDYNIGSWIIRDHGAQNDNPIFGTNASTSVFNFIGIDIDIPIFSGSSRDLVDTQARYRMQGKIATRHTSAIKKIPIFDGDLILTDPNSAEVPQGSYRILCREVGGSAANFGVFKGPHRFYGGDAEITSSFGSEDYTEVSGAGVTAKKLGSGVAVIANDGVLTLEVPGTVPAATLVLTGSGSSDVTSMIYVRASASPSCKIVSYPAGSTAPTTGTGSLVGTTGTPGEFTVHAVNDGTVDLENRLGSSRTIGYAWFAAA